MTQLDPERQQRARQYARISRRLWLLDLVLSAAYALAWVLGGWGQAASGWLVSIWPAASNPWLLVPGFALMFGAPALILGFPLDYYSGFVLPHRFDLSNQTLRGWFADKFKSLLIGGVLGLVLLQFLYLVLRATGDAWWLWASGGMLVFSVLLANLAPILIMPLFNKFVPLDAEHQDLADRLINLAERAHTRVQGVYKFDLSRRTKAANAALTGIGNTRRIILGDTLIQEFTIDEIETVLAHELGHHVHRDILLFLGAGAVSTLLGLFLASRAMNWAVLAFGFSAVSDPAAIPALAIILGAFGLITQPVQNGLSRWREGMADQYALRVTGKGDAFASAFIRLANQNLGEVDPEPWVVWMFYSHPPLGKRIELARAWESAASRA